MTKAMSVAATILEESAARGIDVSNLKLQKLLYYAEAWNLVINKESLFPDDIEAWIHGPVVNSVFHGYKEFRWSPIAAPKSESHCNDAVRSHVKSVLKAYGKFSAFQLERLTHSEKPWIEARKGLHSDQPSRVPISRNTMKEFYSAKIG